MRLWQASRILVCLCLSTALWLVPAAMRAPSALADCVSAGCHAPVPCNTSAGACFDPPVVSRWQYQLSARKDSSGACLFPSTGFINTGITGTSFATGQTVAPVAFDIDIFQDGSCYTPNNYNVLNAAAVSALHAQGAHVIGYIDAGTIEHYRPYFSQYNSFNKSCHGCLFGASLNPPFNDENWLNVKTAATGINPNTGQRETTRQFILDELGIQLDHARHIGADAIEFDNVDGYQNSTGLHISADQQLAFDTDIANLAHSRGFRVGLKNNLAQLSQLKPYFDFAINEQCFEFTECDSPPPGLPAWPTSGKAVFNVEYHRTASQFCAKANEWNFNSIVKTLNLYDTPYTPCR